MAPSTSVLLLTLLTQSPAPPVPFAPACPGPPWATQPARAPRVTLAAGSLHWNPCDLPRPPSVRLHPYARSDSLNLEQIRQRTRFVGAPSPRFFGAPRRSFEAPRREAAWRRRRGAGHRRSPRAVRRARRVDPRFLRPCYTATPRRRRSRHPDGERGESAWQDSGNPRCHNNVPTEYDRFSGSCRART